MPIKHKWLVEKLDGQKGNKSGDFKYPLLRLGSCIYSIYSIFFFSLVCVKSQICSSSQSPFLQSSMKTQVTSTGWLEELFFGSALIALLPLNVFHHWNFSRGLSVILCPYKVVRIIIENDTAVLHVEIICGQSRLKCAYFQAFVCHRLTRQNKHIYIYGVEGEINLLALRLVIGYPPCPIRVMLGLCSFQQSEQ